MAEEARPNEADPQTDAPRSDMAGLLWVRIRDHKILQWGIAYLGAALALGQGADLLGEAFQWPGVVGRVLLILLVAGFPIALTLAWYHGHRGLRQISAGELAIVS